MTMFLYSLKSPYELEKIYRNDQNQFLSEFLMETSVDYESLVSIRSTVVDFVDEAFQFPEFNSQVYLSTIQLLFTESSPGQKETVLAKITKL
jgi:hypothetical protein